MKVNYSIEVIGRVQGVGFRYSAMSVANSLGIYGFVKNTHANSVYIEAEGEEVDMESFITWCKQGPSHARVDNVIAYKGEVKGYEEFYVSK